VLITGASRGIGAQIALQYARAGALLSLVARTQSALDASKDTILREHPSAKVLTFPADVRDVKKVEGVVAATVAHFGRLDILIANAGALRPLDKCMLRMITAIFVADLCHLKPLHRRIQTGGGISLRLMFVAPTTSSSAPHTYFLIMSQAYHVLSSFAVPELLKTKGQVVVVNSSAAQFRIPNMSEYCTSKHAILRFAEFVTIGEYYWLCLLFVLNGKSSSLCRLSRHQGLLRPPWWRKDGHV
jgi:NAD(P)-dependent dehydrogenase (short-subunit alcohol dehydrogenase family)